MSTWHVGGVRVETDGKTITVTGDGLLAERLRLFAGDDSVWIVPPPSGSVRLRVDSDWLVDRWVRQWAGQLGAGPVTSDYEPSDEDIPDDARELLEERADDDYVEGRVY